MKRKLKKSYIITHEEFGCISDVLGCMGKSARDAKTHFIKGFKRVTGIEPRIISVSIYKGAK